MWRQESLCRHRFASGFIFNKRLLLDLWCTIVYHKSMQTIIAHIDMNSYFASCEQQDNLAWRGKPVGVCEHLGGIIIAPSIEAKKYGIKTGMPVWEARRLYPKIILTSTNPNRYRFYTARFLKVFEDYTHRIEKYSIDEAFLDLSLACNIRGYVNGKLTLLDPWQEAARITQEIKTRMQTEVGDWIKCSVGISDCKLVAKIASDLKKPDGLVVVKPEDKIKLYDKLGLTDIPGVARRMEKRLNSLGIKTLAELRDYPVSKLVSYFGVQGYHLHNMGQLQGSWKEGFDNTDDDMKSIGHMYTIPIEYRKKNMLQPVLYKLSEMVARRLRANKLMAGGIHVHIHDPERICINKGANIGSNIEDGREIFLEAINLIKASGLNLVDAAKSSYLIGVTAFDLKPRLEQKSLFSKYKSYSKLNQAIDKINDKYQDFTITRVPAFLARDVIRDSVGFGRMKEFSKNPASGSFSRFK